MKRKLESQMLDQNEKSRIILHYEDKKAELEFMPPIPVKQLRKLIAEKFQQNPGKYFSFPLLYRC
jgi:hypothetical protein